MQHTATIKQVKAIIKATPWQLEAKTPKELNIDYITINLFQPSEANWSYYIIQNTNTKTLYITQFGQILGQKTNKI